MHGRMYGSAISALETTYINLCVRYKSYGYLDEIIDSACTEGNTYVLVNIDDIPSDSETENMKNKEFVTKMVSIFYNLGYQFEMKDDKRILISWMEPYKNLKE